MEASPKGRALLPLWESAGRAGSAASSPTDSSRLRLAVAPATPASASLPPGPAAALAVTAPDVATTARALRTQVARRIVGLDDVVEQVLITLLAGGHALLEGVPGLTKTLLLSTTAELLDLAFSRIQFTPDLMPSDVTGSEYLVQDTATGQREFRF